MDTPTVPLTKHSDKHAWTTASAKDPDSPRPSLPHWKRYRLRRIILQIANVHDVRLPWLFPLNFMQFHLPRAPALSAASEPLTRRKRVARRASGEWMAPTEDRFSSLGCVRPPGTKPGNNITILYSASYNGGEMPLGGGCETRLQGSKTARCHALSRRNEKNDQRFA